MSTSQQWAVTVAFHAATADEASNVRDVIAGTLAGETWQDFTVSDAIGCPAAVTRSASLTREMSAQQIGEDEE